MPDREVQTIRDIIYYQYAKIITKSAFNVGDGKNAKSSHYGFIKKTFRELKDGTKSWSDILREDIQFVEAGKECVYCKSNEKIEREHIVPKSISINDKCSSCDRIHQIHNLIWGCKDCNLSKGTLGLYEFFRKKYPNEKKFYDLIPTLVEKKYLKTIYHCHSCSNTLDCGDIDGDNEISVLDIDFVIRNSPIRNS